MEIERQQLRVNGISMHVAVAGRGPEVLLVHGFPDTHAVWRKQIPALVGAGYRVIAPDTRGCGETEMPAAVSDYHVDPLVADLVGLLDALAIDRVRLVAHDWGSAISWLLAARHPERVDRYVALSTGHPAAYRRGGLEQRLKGYYTLLFRPPRFAEWLLRAGHWRGLRALTGYPEECPQWISQLSRPGRLTAALAYYRANWRLLFSGDARPARVPVLGVWSSGDRFLAERQMRDSARLVDGPFQYARIDGANHWLQLSGAERFNPLLLDYLK
jgi:pimeloyl-ACP methyl ester carboxylesterase